MNKFQIFLLYVAMAVFSIIPTTIAAPDHANNEHANAQTVLLRTTMEKIVARKHAKPTLRDSRAMKRLYSLAIGAMFLAMVFGPLLLVIGLLQAAVRRIAPTAAKGGEGRGGHGYAGNNPFRALWNAIWNGFKAPPDGKIEIGLGLIGVFLVIFSLCYLLHRYAGFEHPLTFDDSSKQVMENSLQD
jgi:hypothetical protein